MTPDMVSKPAKLYAIWPAFIAEFRTPRSAREMRCVGRARNDCDKNKPVSYKLADASLSLFSRAQGLNTVRKEVTWAWWIPCIESNDSPEIADRPHKSPAYRRLNTGITDQSSNSERHTAVLKVCPAPKNVAKSGNYDIPISPLNPTR